jgi:hypothetical protein
MNKYSDICFHCTSMDGSTFWTMITAMATIVLCIVGGFQLNKIRSSGTLQFFVALEKEWLSKRMKKQRMEVAQLIIEKQMTNKKQWDDELPKDKRIEFENKLEDIINFFEKICLITKRDEFDLELVYEMYSYHLQAYWQFLNQVNYIDDVRKDPNCSDYYVNYQWVINRMNKHDEPKYHWEALQPGKMNDFFEEEAKLLFKTAQEK